MPWWGWLLLGWSVLAVAAGFWIGATAALTRRRERDARAHLYTQSERPLRRRKAG